MAVTTQARVPQRNANTVQHKLVVSHSLQILVFPEIIAEIQNHMEQCSMQKKDVLCIVKTCLPKNDV